MPLSAKSSPALLEQLNSGGFGRCAFNGRSLLLWSGAESAAEELQLPARNTDAIRLAGHMELIKSKLITIFRQHTNVVV